MFPRVEMYANLYALWPSDRQYFVCQIFARPHRVASEKNDLVKNVLTATNQPLPKGRTDELRQEVAAFCRIMLILCYDGHSRGLAYPSGKRNVTQYRRSLECLRRFGLVVIERQRMQIHPPR